MSAPARAWRTLRHDIGRKLTAFGLAVGTWFILESLVLADLPAGLSTVEVKTVGSITEADLDRAQSSSPRLYLVVPDGLIVEAYAPKKLELNVKGLKTDVENLVLSSQIILRESDLPEGVDEGEVLRTINRESFKSRGDPPELTLFQINRGSTADIRILLARKASLEVALGPANVQHTGVPAAGHAVEPSRSTVSPNVLTISGPRSKIARFRAEPAALKLAPIAVDGRIASVTRAVGLADLPENRNVKLETKEDKVSVTVAIVPEPKRRQLLAIPLMLRNEDALKSMHLRVAENGGPPPTVDLVVDGPPSELDALSNEDLARRIFPILDFKAVDGVEGRSGYDLTVAKVELSLAVRVSGLDTPNGPPRIYLTLEKVPENP